MKTFIATASIVIWSIFTILVTLEIVEVKIKKIESEISRIEELRSCQSVI